MTDWLTDSVHKVNSCFDAMAWPQNIVDKESN